LVLLVLVGVLSFVAGSRWLLNNVPFLMPYRDLWPILCVLDVFAWLIHGSQVDVLITGSWVGAEFASVTLLTSSVLLGFSSIPVVVAGEVISMGSMSKVGAIAVTPLCSGFLSFVMFTLAFSIVLFDVGWSMGWWRLASLFLVGFVSTFIISTLRVYLVLVLGYYWGWDALNAAHLYLGYVLFLCLISAFWYCTFEWRKRLSLRSTLAPRS
jgi:exosortase/archaeosortase family protein